MAIGILKPLTSTYSEAANCISGNLPMEIKLILVDAPASLLASFRLLVSHSRSCVDLPHEKKMGNCLPTPLMWHAPSLPTALANMLAGVGPPVGGPVAMASNFPMLNNMIIWGLARICDLDNTGFRDCLRQHGLLSNAEGCPSCGNAMHDEPRDGW